MPNGTTRVLPSPTGGGLTAGTGAVRQAAETQEILRQRRRELSQRERQIDMAERAQAFEEFTTIAPFLPPGTEVASMPGFAKDRLRQLFPEFDPDDPEDFGGLTFNPLEPSDILTQLFIDEAGELGENLDPEAVNRFTNLTVFGEAATGEELDLRSLRTRVLLNSLENLAQNPDALEDMARAAMGLDQEVRFNFGGRDYTFSSEASGQIWASLFGTQMRELFGLQARRLEDDPVKELMDQYAAAFDNERQLGRAASQRIIEAWNQTMQGEFEAGNTPIEQLYSQSDPDIRQAIQLLTGSLRAGDQRFQEILEEVPGGPETLFFQWIAGRNRETFGPEEGLEETRNFFRQFENSPFGVRVERPFFGITGRPRFTFEQGSPEETIARDPTQSIPEPGEQETGGEDSVTRESAIQTIRESLNTGIASEEDLRSDFGDEIVDEALGGGEARESGAPPPGEEPPEPISSADIPDFDTLRASPVGDLEAMSLVIQDSLGALRQLESGESGAGLQERLTARAESARLEDSLSLINRLIRQKEVMERTGGARQMGRRIQGTGVAPGLREVVGEPGPPPPGSRRGGF